jgi:hypothetical protein
MVSLQSLESLLSTLMERDIVFIPPNSEANEVQGLAALEMATLSVGIGQMGTVAACMDFGKTSYSLFPS